MNDAKRIRPVLVSACLAGEKCRYDGTAASHPVVQELVKRGLAVAVCPEALGGLPTPREPMELLGGRVIGKGGTDHTKAVASGARMACLVAVQKGCTRAILKARSPSCGVGKVYDGTFSGKLVPGNGLLAALLKDEGVEVLTELDL